MAAIADLYRYPVKGLSPEPLTTMALSATQGLPFDRDYALALGTTAFDPNRPEPLDKGYFLMLRNNEALAALRTRLDHNTHRLTIEHAERAPFSADLSTPEGRAEAETYFAEYLGAATKGPPRVVRAEGHKFTDASVLSPVMMRAVSVINLASGAARSRQATSLSAGDCERWIVEAETRLCSRRGQEHTRSPKRLHPDHLASDMRKVTQINLMILIQIRIGRNKLGILLIGRWCGQNPSELSARTPSYR